MGRPLIGPRTFRSALKAALPFVFALMLASPGTAHAAVPLATVAAVQGPAGPVAPKVTVTIGQGSEQLQLSGAVGIVVFMGAMTLLPAMFLLMTSFTRILIVLHFVRTAIGTQTAPPGQLLVALAVLLTGVVMQPVIKQANTEALQPYLNGQIDAGGWPTRRRITPLAQFMLANTREKDLGVFAELTGNEQVPTASRRCRP